MAQASDDLLQNKTCLITGATSGIGYVTALEIARHGATVALVGRDRGRAQDAVTRICQETGNSGVDFLLADLSSQEQVRQLANDFTQRYPNLHILINDAGAVFWSPQETVDGLEMTFALNHLAPFLLTNLLLPTLRASAPVGRSTPFMNAVFTLIRPFAISPEKGAATAIYLATSPDVATTSGLYFVKQKPARSSPASYNQESARRLWTVSEQLTGVRSTSHE